jgi:hypothetical protein
VATHRQHLTFNDGTNLQAGNDVDDKHGNLLAKMSYKLMNISFCKPRMVGQILPLHAPTECLMRRHWGFRQRTDGNPLHEKKQ